MHPYVASLLGGLLIGIASLLLLFLNGRILGISGIIGGMLNRHSKDKTWRIFFVSGLILGGGLFFNLYPENFQNVLTRPLWLVALAGFLVGYGTSQANGCTSGHGVCGISRFSMRSILATLTFIFFGALTVFIIRHLMGIV